MELPEVMAALGAELVVPAARWDGRCPVCGAATSSARSGTGLRLCRICSEAEVGESAEDLARRVSRKLTRKRYEALPRDTDGRPVLPSLTNRQWREITG